MDMVGTPYKPAFLKRLCTDEYEALPYSGTDLRVISRATDAGSQAAHRRGLTQANYWQARMGTAAGLRALNDEWDDIYYVVPPEAMADQDSADAALGGDQLVVDVQTHFLVQRPPTTARTTGVILDVYRQLMPEWWGSMGGLAQYSLAEYLRCVFLETDNAVAVLSSGPGLNDVRHIFNDEMAATREYLGALGASGRLYNHTVVHPNHPEEIAAMEHWQEVFAPAGWKVYTPGVLQDGAAVEQSTGTSWVPGTDWRLDDDITGGRFLTRCEELGSRVVCAHKGISGIPAASPADVGPAARAFPMISFVIYHSGYELPFRFPEEGPWTEETRDQGVNRLVSSLKDAGIPPGRNVYAELGTTWFTLIRRPTEAAHVLGKLLLAVGEDNIVWGSDGVWYGSPQPSIDAFRAFQIPEAMRERYGYPQLTPEVKAKILGLNACRLYGLDPDEARKRAQNDDLAWAKAAFAELRKDDVAFETED